MSKTKILAVLLVAALMLSACFGSPSVNQGALTAEEFTQRAEAAGYVAEDISGAFSPLGPLDLQIRFFVNAPMFDAEFYAFQTDVTAQMLYERLKYGLGLDIGGSVQYYSETNEENFNIFRQTADGRFDMLVRVENTLITISADAENREYAEAFLRVLGY